MYAGFFGLQQAPFSIAPDPRYLYLSERHREALAHLLYGLQGGGGFVVLTGEIGAGKTTICRHFLAQVPAHCQVAYIFNPLLSVVDLLATICHEFGIEAPNAPLEPTRTKPWLDALNAHLLAAHAAGAISVLVIDEAQSLSVDVLEQLRLLTNLETDERKLLQIMLIGQPELRTQLAQPELEQLAQRVIARCHLEALNAEETRCYIEHRLRTAGLAGPSPFSDDALDRVFALSHGIPRRINLLCDRALLGAYAQQRRRIAASGVDQAAQEVFGDLPVRAATQPAPPRNRAWVGLWGGLAGASLTWLLAWLIGVWPAAAPEMPLQAALTDTSNPPTAPATRAPVAPASAASPADDAPPPSEAEQPNRAEASDPLDGRALHTDEGAALAQLAQHWALPAQADEPCASALRQQHQCYRMPRMTLRGIQAFDRPAVLRLHPPDGPAGYAILTQWQGDRLQLLARERVWTVSADTLEGLWRGEYASYWRTPVPLGRHLHSGTDPQVAPWLARSLAQLQAQGQLPPRTQGGLPSQVAAFQKAHGLEATGQASPTTLILLNRALQVPEPRLSGADPTAPAPLPVH